MPKTEDFFRQYERPFKLPTGEISKEAPFVPAAPRPSSAVSAERELSRFEAEHEGVDIRSGGPSSLRMRLSFQPDEKAKENILDKAIGKGNWRRDKEGNLIIRHGGKDKLLDERGLSWGDLADFVGSMPEVAGGALGVAAAAALGLNPATWAGLLGTVAISSFMSQAAGAGGEEASRAVEGIPRSKTIASRRTAGTAMELSMGFGTGTILKLLRKGAGIISGPFSKGVRSEESQSVAEAATRMRGEKAKIDLSPAQITGSPTLARVEGMAEKIPGAGEPIKRAQQAQDEALRAYQTRVAGPPEESLSIGQRMTAELETQRQIPERAAAMAREEVERRSLSGMGAVRRDISPVVQSVEEAGKKGLAGVLAQRETFRERVKSLYQAVRDEPGGSDAFVPTTHVKAEAKKILNELPKEKGGQVARAYVPSEVRRFLEGHDRLSDAMTIDQIIQMRRIVNDAISQGEGLPGISTRYLRNISHALTRDLDEAVKSAPNPAIAKKLSEASQYYKGNFQKFLEPGIAEFFREPTQRGGVTPMSLVEKLFSGRGDVDLARKLKGLLPEGDWNQLRAASFDWMLERSQNILSPGAIDPKRLASSLETMSPEMRREVFGNRWGEVLSYTRALAARYGEIPLDKVKDLGDNLVGGLRRAAKIEENAKREFENSIVRPFLKDKIGETAINPEEFVRHMMRTGSPGQIAQTMQKFTPELREKIHNKAIQHILQDSARSPTPSDVIKELGDRPGFVLSGRSLLKNLSNGYGKDVSTSLARLRAIIGPENIQRLKDLGTIAATRERQEEAASAAGGLVAGTIIKNIMRGSISGAEDIAKFRLFSIIMQTKAGRAWLTSGIEVPEARNLARAAILGAETWPKIQKEFTSDPDALNQILETFGLDPKEAPTPPPRRTRTEDFLRQFEVKSPPETEANTQPGRTQPDMREGNQKRKRIIERIPVPSGLLE